MSETVGYRVKLKIPASNSDHKRVRLTAIQGMPGRKVLCVARLMREKGSVSSSTKARYRPPAKMRIIPHTYPTDRKRARTTPAQNMAIARPLSHQVVSTAAIRFFRPLRNGRVKTANMVHHIPAMTCRAGRRKTMSFRVASMVEEEFHT